MSAYRPYLLVLCLGILLGFRFGGAHLHLCFDGQEPAAALHFADVGPEHAESVGASHVDENIDVATEGLVGSGDIEWSPALLGTLLALFLVFARPAVPSPVRVPEILRGNAAALRPPLRGPPLTTRA